MEELESSEPSLDASLIYSDLGSNNLSDYKMSLLHVICSLQPKRALELLQKVDASKIEA
jgi:hypothetical protein